ncbi:bifunctional 5,10-methylenetetrahydrofolate dehydrogenase/5,10-methenyltetrahydrofolate cyclohydrolase [Hymenobacter defluvii]|uniref:Bifunctional protein FolD n=1 Tax=Hymenobacter defluvii TaxID=2054411 RepID=A0ABS3T7J8_9BACT|nr:tetrahydrofolate dehydrogenase/cyclohydrolase catalytic domain-containing protein [Hymenobacter defluvii]MBO3269600.1 bifunctional 5,10-methylene-tetrahydrofolate dehydrogenase/5,10-methylene-tetrahydrofolate cyclohydrolase [Hymenobacter defluvii]
MTPAPEAATYQLIDGKKTAEDIKVEIAAEVVQLKAAGQKVPHLAAILVGHDGGSETYVRNKVLACERVGYSSTLLRYEDTITEAELLAKVEELNQDPEIDGFIVQLPLPKHINAEKVIEAVRPEKDVDGFHPMNLGRMVAGLPALLPATPSGIVELLKRYDIKTSGKHCVVIGRSNIVGTPVSILLAKNLEPGNCTVTLCHSRTANIAEITRQADIVVAALGRPEFVTSDMVKPGAVVIDVGTTRVEDASRKSGFVLKGDVNFTEVAPLTSYITPVPGGVGPMTIAMLLLNTLRAAKGEVYPR